ncbi:hypothetical protein [Actinophytocola sp.]|uniref:hypothetical protein n=1 Tax=Actinophytocola sp. TaxID=1872138 RepID=UPI002D7F6E85|nr:hypothetical protein [Actinophytocola sp.]HET9139183.1 hypothetical protein [Actinophytocola sp.]HEU5109218.1 hypothetical protein [Micromonosporaceae bacterium]
MNDKQLTAGLNLLADEYSEPVDIDGVIDAERSRRLRRRSVAAVTLGIVVLLTAVSVVTVTMNLGQRDQGAGPPTSTAGPTMINGRKAVAREVDDRARKLTAQLAGARTALLPNLTVGPDSENTKGFREGTPPGLEFGKLVLVEDLDKPQRFVHYEALARLSDQQGVATFRISVYSPETPEPDGCYPGLPTCTSRTLPDGTKATWRTHLGDAMGWNQAMTARRPDGTLIMVRISVWNLSNGDKPTRPEVPLTQDQLYLFATVFSY